MIDQLPEEDLLRIYNKILLAEGLCHNKCQLKNLETLSKGPTWSKDREYCKKCLTRIKTKVSERY